MFVINSPLNLLYPYIPAQVEQIFQAVRNKYWPDSTHDYAYYQDDTSDCLLLHALTGSVLFASIFYLSLDEAVNLMHKHILTRQKPTDFNIYDFFSLLFQKYIETQAPDKNAIFNQVIFYLEDLLHVISEMEYFCIPSKCQKMRAYSPTNVCLCASHTNPMEVSISLFYTHCFPLSIYISVCLSIHLLFFFSVVL